MLSISHCLTGAFIASQVPDPAVYTPLVLASHYFEDWIPHWDVGTGLGNGTRKRSTAFLLEIGDLFLAGVIVLIVFAWTNGDLWPLTGLWPKNPQTFNAIFGAFLGLLPDLIEAPRNFLKWEPFFIKPLNKFHGSWHHSTPNKWLGLTPQIILWGLITGLVFYARSR